MENEQIFKALADENRRRLLDALHERNGQTLSELCEHVAQEMGRFGCMKHLQILEEAGLVTTKKVGREKYHYLNAVPIQLVYERWVSKYAAPWAQSLAMLKLSLEESSSQANQEGPSMIETNPKPAHIFQTFIRATPEKVWQALTDGTLTPQYYMGCKVISTWQVGAHYDYVSPDGTSVWIDGEVLECDPPRRLVTTFHDKWVPNVEVYPTRVEWDIEPRGAACKVTVTHYDLKTDHPLTAGMIEGWAQILAGMKTLLETDFPLIIDG